MRNQRLNTFKHNVIFTALIVIIAVAIAYALVVLTLPIIVGDSNKKQITPMQSKTESSRGDGSRQPLPTGDAKRVADLDRISNSLKDYGQKYGGYPESRSMTCDSGDFDTDAELLFLFDLERAAVIDGIPRDVDGMANAAKMHTASSSDLSAGACETMYGAKHYLYYSNGSKFALIASVDDISKIPKGKDNAFYLGNGDYEWFDGSALIGKWGWSKNVYIVTSEPLKPLK